MAEGGTFRECRKKQELSGKRLRVKLAKKLRERGTSSRSWSGELSETPIGDFLISEFKIDTGALTDKQRAQLDQDIIRISLDNRTTLRNQAKLDIKSTDAALKALEKLGPKIEDLSPDFWTQKGQGVESHPAFAVLALRERLEAHRHLAEEEADRLGRGREAITSRALCLHAIHVFLRWRLDDRPNDKRGLSYPLDWPELVVLSKESGIGKHSEPKSILANFLESCTEVLGKPEVARQLLVNEERDSKDAKTRKRTGRGWDFDYWDHGLVACQEIREKFSSNQPKTRGC